VVRRKIGCSLENSKMKPPPSIWRRLPVDHIERNFSVDVELENIILCVLRDKVVTSVDGVHNKSIPQVALAG
jgi:hypothetical protein